MPKKVSKTKTQKQQPVEPPKKNLDQTLQKPILISLLCLLVIVSFAVALSTMPKNKSATMTTQQTVPTQTSLTVASSQDTTATQNMEAVPAGERVKFRINSFQKLALQPLRFQIFDEQGKELTPDFLRSVQGEKVHFFLTHANMKEFQHLLPSYANGTWNVSANMPTPGTYYAYTVFNPIRGKNTTLRSDLIVREASAADEKTADPTTGLTTTSGAYKAAMNMQRTASGRVFSYVVTQGEQAAAVQPVFESLGQLSIFKHQSPGTFMTFMADPFSNESQGKISFASGVLSPGRYTAFAEFRLGGRVFIFPMTFDVGA